MMTCRCRKNKLTLFRRNIKFFSRRGNQLLTNITSEYMTVYVCLQRWSLSPPTLSAAKADTLKSHCNPLVHSLASKILLCIPNVLPSKIFFVRAFRFRNSNFFIMTQRNDYYMRLRNKTKIIRVRTFLQLLSNCESFI